MDPRVIHRLKINALCINRNYDLPYVAGSSTNRRTVYIDRHFPRDGKLKIAGRAVDVTPFILCHEMFETAMFDFYGEKYLQSPAGPGAHNLASVYEDDEVAAAGIKPRLYERAFKPYIKSDAKEQLEITPPDLDLQPYRDSGDKVLADHVLMRAERTHPAFG